MKHLGNTKAYRHLWSDERIGVFTNYKDSVRNFDNENMKLSQFRRYDGIIFLNRKKTL